MVLICQYAAQKVNVEKWPCAVRCENCDIGSVQYESCSKWVHARCEGLEESCLKYLSG